MIPTIIPANTSVTKCWARYTLEYPTNQATMGKKNAAYHFLTRKASKRASVKAVLVCPDGKLFALLM